MEISALNYDFLTLKKLLAYVNGYTDKTSNAAAINNQQGFNKEVFNYLCGHGFSNQIERFLEYYSVNRNLIDAGLNIAAENGNVETVKCLLARLDNKNLHKANDKQYSIYALQYMAKSGYLIGVKKLLDSERFTKEVYNDAAISAANHSYIEIVKLLMTHCHDISLINNDERALKLAVYYFIDQESDTAVKGMLNSNVLSKMVINDALKYAADKGKVNIVNILIGFKDTKSLKFRLDDYKYITLQFFIEGNYKQNFHTLISSRIFKADEISKALDYAIKLGHIDLVKLFFTTSTPENQDDNQLTENVVNYFVSENHLEGLRLLLKQDGIKSELKAAALIDAAKLGYIDMVKLILEYQDQNGFSEKKDDEKSIITLEFLIRGGYTTAVENILSSELWLSKTTDLRLYDACRKAGKDMKSVLQEKGVSFPFYMWFKCLFYRR